MNYSFAFLAVVLLIAALSASAHAEVTGNISTGNITFSSSNTSITTGLFGYTVNTCTRVSTTSSNSSCFDYKCLFDYDSGAGVGNTSILGTCFPTSFTGCIHDASSSGTTMVNGSSYICATNTTYRQCSSGTWESASSCSSGQTCSVGAVSTSSPCAAPGTGTGTTGSSGSTNTTGTTVGVINITLSATVLGIIQGNSSAATITIKNTGNASLVNITLSVSGINGSWYSVLPSKITSLSVGNSNPFNVSFSIPQNAEVKSYTVTFTAAAPGASSKSASMTLNILPSTSTVLEINETYVNYTFLYSVIEKNVTELEKTNVNQEDLATIKSILDDIKNKLSQANTSISQGDYFAAKQSMDAANNLINTLNEKIGQVRYETPSVLPGVDNTIIFIIAGAIVIVIGVIAFLFWPTKKTKISFDAFRK